MHTLLELLGNSLHSSAQGLVGAAGIMALFILLLGAGWYRMRQLRDGK